jgi:hypothetical protein
MEAETSNFMSDKLDNIMGDDGEAPMDGGGGGGAEGDDDDDDENRREQWAAFGWKVNPESVFQINFQNLEVILDSIGSQLQVQEKKIANPPWLKQIEETNSKASLNTNEVLELKKQIASLKLDMEEMGTGKSGKKRKGSGSGGSDDDSGSGSGSGSDDDDADSDDGGGGGGGGGGGDVDLGPLTKQVKHLKLDLSNIALMMEGIKKSTEQSVQIQKLSAATEFSNVKMDMEQLRRLFSTVASSNDWKETQKYYTEQIANLKRTSAAQALATERKLDEKMNQDLQMAAKWRGDVESTFNEQLKMMDDRVAVIQDDVYAIRTGHGLELNELEDRFEEHLTNTEVTFRHVQNDLKRLVKRTADADDRLSVHDEKNKLQDGNIEELFQKIEEANIAHMEVRDEHKEHLQLLDERMQARVEDHERVMIKLEEYQRNFDAIDARFARTDEVIADHLEQLKACREQERLIKEDIAEIKEITIVNMKEDHKALVDRVQKFDERTVKALAKLKAGLEKTNMTLEATQKELKGFNERLTTAEEAVEQLDLDVKETNKNLDSHVAELTTQVLAVDHKCAEIGTVRKKLEATNQRIFAFEKDVSLIDDKAERLKQKTDMMATRTEEVKQEADSKLSQMGDEVKTELAEQAELIADVQNLGAHRDKAIFNLGNVVAENERRAEMHREPSSEVKLWLEELVALCLEFENETVPEKSPSIGLELAEVMARRAQNLAEYFAKEADFETIRKFLSRTDPEDESYEENIIDMLRHEMTEDFLVSVFTEISRQHASATPIMMEARAKYKNKLRQAIETALTKFEQVEVAGISRLMGMPLKPRCVACDRPLQNKRRVKDGPSQHTGARPTTAPDPGSMSRGDVSAKSGGAPNNEYLGGDSRPIMIPGGGNYVYRGGFRMAKSQTAGELPHIS